MVPDVGDLVCVDAEAEKGSSGLLLRRPIRDLAFAMVEENNKTTHILRFTSLLEKYRCSACFRTYGRPAARAHLPLVESIRSRIYHLHCDRVSLKKEHDFDVFLSL